MWSEISAVIKEYLVEESHCGARVDRYVRSLLPGVAQSFIERLLRKGEILLNHAKVKASARVSSGDVLIIKGVERIVVDEREKRDVHCSTLLELISGSIVYEDEHIIAINKPPGVSVQGGSKVRISISDILDTIRPGESCKIVHRLDKDTSGVLVLAKNLGVARYLAQEFRDRRVEKEYVAVTAGVPDPSIGEVNTPISYKKKSGDGWGTVEKEARTVFSVVQSFAEFAVVQLRPVTGRKHQLRIHMSQIGCPIVGDSKHCRATKCSDGLHLHASLLAFELMGRKVSIAAPMPDHMQATIAGLSVESKDKAD
ncbi:MAG: RluA family pseudouridine synthase [Anaplasma sp.]